MPREGGLGYQQNDPEARAQERLVDQAYKIYEIKAAKAGELWAKYAITSYIGAKAHVQLLPDNPGFAEYQKAAQAKAEAKQAWDREAYKHGHMMLPKEGGTG